MRKLQYSMNNISLRLYWKEITTRSFSQINPQCKSTSTQKKVRFINWKIWMKTSKKWVMRNTCLWVQAVRTTSNHQVSYRITKLAPDWAIAKKESCLCVFIGLCLRHSAMTFLQSSLFNTIWAKYYSLNIVIFSSYL